MQHTKCCCSCSCNGGAPVTVVLADTHALVCVFVMQGIAARSCLLVAPPFNVCMWFSGSPDISVLNGIVGPSIGMADILNAISQLYTRKNNILYLSILHCNIGISANIHEWHARRTMKGDSTPQQALGWCNSFKSLSPQHWARAFHPSKHWGGAILSRAFHPSKHIDGRPLVRIDAL